MLLPVSHFQRGLAKGKECRHAVSSYPGCVRSAPCRQLFVARPGNLPSFVKIFPFLLPGQPLAAYQKSECNVEQSFLAWLKGRQNSLPQIQLGIGDDAAIVRCSPGHELVVANDGIVDGVDFLASTHSLREVGRKAIAINLSDLAAMRAEPTAILVQLSLPQQNSTQIAAEVYEGILDICRQYDVAIAGGDLTVYPGPLAIGVTILGQVPTGEAWQRCGAQPGDAIVVTGAFGGSLLGRHLQVQPRVREALRIASLANIRAAIDVSDGLSLDLDRLCAASGVGAELAVTQIPIHADAYRQATEEAQGDGKETAAKTNPTVAHRTPLQHALGDGEDFELVMAVAPEEVDRLLASDCGVSLTRIGTFTKRTGLWLQHTGKLERLAPSGYIHGAERG